MNGGRIPKRAAIRTNALTAVADTAIARILAPRELTMNYREFGSNQQETILLLHGGGLNWWNYREEAAMLAAGYHVILPILDGHAGSDRPFTSIESNAAEIIAFIDGHLNGSVLLIGGLSLGGQVLLDMLAQRSNICRYALVESAAVLPSRLTRALIGPAVGSSFGLIRNRRFSRLQFRSLHIKTDLFEDYYRDTCGIGKSDMIAFLKANTGYALKQAVENTSARVHVFAGEKETREILRSAEAIRKAIPESRLRILPGFRHGEFSLNHAEAYIGAVLREILAQPIRGEGNPPGP